jgi:hypothetical protein
MSVPVGGTAFLGNLSHHCITIVPTARLRPPRLPSYLRPNAISPPLELPCATAAASLIPVLEPPPPPPRPHLHSEQARGGARAIRSRHEAKYERFGADARRSGSEDDGVRFRGEDADLWAAGYLMAWIRRVGLRDSIGADASLRALTAILFLLAHTWHARLAARDVGAPTLATGAAAAISGANLGIGGLRAARAAATISGAACAEELHGVETTGLLPPPLRDGACGAR